MWEPGIVEVIDSRVAELRKLFGLLHLEMRSETYMVLTQPRMSLFQDDETQTGEQIVEPP